MQVEKACSLIEEGQVGELYCARANYWESLRRWVYSGSDFFSSSPWIIRSRWNLPVKCQTGCLIHQWQGAEWWWVEQPTGSGHWGCGKWQTWSWLNISAELIHIFSITKPCYAFKASHAPESPLIIISVIIKFTYTLPKLQAKYFKLGLIVFFFTELS